MVLIKQNLEPGFRSFVYLQGHLAFTGKNNSDTRMVISLPNNYMTGGMQRMVM